jgi:hypothetical protein
MAIAMHEIIMPNQAIVFDDSKRKSTEFERAEFS